MQIKCNNFVNGIVEQIGNQPVRVFYYRLKSIFEDIRKELGVEFPDTKLSNIEFKYDLDNNTPRGPYCTCNYIQFHESFLSFLWTYSYGLALSLPGMNPIQDQLQDLLGRAVSKEEFWAFYKIELKKGRKLLDYSFVLLKIFTVWDKELLPNPEVYTRADSRTIGKINSLFFHGFIFILYHEFAHIILEHDPLATDQAKRKRMEEAADEFALTQMLKNANEDLETVTRGIIYALGSLTFCSDNFRGGKFHPDVDYRILKVLETFDFDENHVSWATGSWAILQWYSKSDVQITFPTPFRNYKDTFYCYLEKIKDIKEKKAK